VSITLETHQFPIRRRIYQDQVVSISPRIYEN